MMGMFLLPLGEVLNSSIGEMIEDDSRVDHAVNIVRSKKTRVERKNNILHAVGKALESYVINAATAYPVLFKLKEEYNGQIFTDAASVLYIFGYDKDGVVIHERTMGRGDPLIIAEILALCEESTASTQQRLSASNNKSQCTDWSNHKNNSSPGHRRWTRSKKSNGTIDYRLGCKDVTIITDRVWAIYWMNNNRLPNYYGVGDQPPAADPDNQNEADSDGDSEAMGFGSTSSKSEDELSAGDEKPPKHNTRRPQNNKRAAQKAKEQKLAGDGKVFDYHLGPSLLDHGFSSCAKIMDHCETSLIITAVALAYPLVWEVLNHCQLPWDYFFDVGDAFRASLGLETEEEKSFDQAECRFECRCDPVIPFPIRESLVKRSNKASSRRTPGKKKGANRKGEDETVLLSPMIISFTRGMLSPDCHQAWLDHQDSLPYCKQNDKSYVRATIARHRPENEEAAPIMPWDQQEEMPEPTPIAHIGVASILTVPATTPEALFTLVKAKLNMMLVDAVNEQIRLILQCQDMELGNWRTQKNGSRNGQRE